MSFYPVFGFLLIKAKQFKGISIDRAIDKLCCVGRSETYHIKCVTKSH